jgi:hypothetical protein
MARLTRQTKKNPAAVLLGRLGGLVSTPAKRKAARKNGRLGGRPRCSRKPHSLRA